ncbi:MAG: hypothetical protein HY751_12130 [Nitrospinae bacterium]|nr:hypothetical protein [Nitrospinota bacterium]
MKKLTMITAMAVMAGALILAPAIASSYRGDPARRGPYYTDTDGNGVCDKAGVSANQEKSQPGDSSSPTVCPMRGGGKMGFHKGASAGGAGFVDEDNNGVCDRLE